MNNYEIIYVLKLLQGLVEISWDVAEQVPPKVGDMNVNVVKYYEFGIKSIRYDFIDYFIEFYVENNIDINSQIIFSSTWN